MSTADELPVLSRAARQSAADIKTAHVHWAPTWVWYMLSSEASDFICFVLSRSVAWCWTEGGEGGPGEQQPLGLETAVCASRQPLYPSRHFNGPLGATLGGALMHPAPNAPPGTG